MPKSDLLENRPPILPITWVGLLIALFGMLLPRQIVNCVSPGTTFTNAILKEAGMWLVAIVLIAIIHFGEGLPLNSNRVIFLSRELFSRRRCPLRLASERRHDVAMCVVNGLATADPIVLNELKTDELTAIFVTILKRSKEQ